MKVALGDGSAVLSSVEQQVPPLRSPGFPVESSAIGQVRAPLSAESRIRGRCSEQ
jgi:hypothetical protein